MAILKCKMCGGDMEISADKTFGICEYCGSTMTLPKVGDEQRATAFNRGNHFRRSGEFDKALAVYERIVAEDDTDAEAHWCCALCRFGIEYVEDPTTYEWLPTCHRASFDSFLEDVDYLAAVENSDGITKRQYQKDAAKIAEVQRGILATSQNAEPYDVFISYKELDKDGNRTRDSILAQDIYYQLTEQGRRVFFSRITLEDVPGTQYEPYIFAALNSAKVMIVVGTSAENLNAVWVKNEWSRYLSMMRKDRTKLLLPCYRDMDPYDLPEQLSVLMSYDMGKIGFIQDLIRGVNKVLDADKKPEAAAVRETVVVQQGGGTTTEAQIKRGNMALEDGEWQKADGFFEEALNLNPECAEAFLGKLLAANRCENFNAYTRKQIERYEDVSYNTLAACEEESEHIEKAAVENAVPDYLAADEIRKLYVFDRSYKSALANREAQKKRQLEELRSDKLLSRVKQYAAGELKAGYDGLISAVAAALDARIADARSADEKRMAEVKKVYADHITKADAEAVKLRLAAEERRENDYRSYTARMEKAGSIEEYTKLQGDFAGLKGYKDSDALAEECGKTAEKMKERAAADKAKAQKKQKTIITVIAAAAAVCIAVALVTVKVIIPNGRYNDAIALLESGAYTDAIAAFEAMDGYKDSANKITECFNAIEEQNKENMYQNAVALMQSGDYEEAIVAFNEIHGYKDSEDKITECQNAILESMYQNAVELENSGDIAAAAMTFGKLGDYKDARARSFELWDVIAVRDTVSSGERHTVGLKTDGTVVAVGDNGNGKCEVSDWTDIVAVSASYEHTVGLRADGTVVAVGGNDYGQCNVGDWTDIVAVIAGSSHTVGLRADGTVVAVGGNDYGECNVGDWTDIVAVSAGSRHTVGLRADGTVVAVGGNNFGQCNVGDWTDIVAVIAGTRHTVGLRADGTVAAVGAKYYGQCNVGDWTDIVAVSAGPLHTVGLRADGTVVAVGYNYYGQCNVGDWTDIVAVSAGSFHTVGLRADGTVVAAGHNEYGQCNVGDWRDIKLP